MGKNNKGGNNNKGNAPAASGDSSKILDNATAAMKRTIDFMAKDFGAVRTGKASPAMVEGIMVECYGGQSKLKDATAKKKTLFIKTSFFSNSKGLVFTTTPLRFRHLIRNCIFNTSYYM